MLTSGSETTKLSKIKNLIAIRKSENGDKKVTK